MSRNLRLSMIAIFRKKGSEHLLIVFLICFSGCTKWAEVSAPNTGLSGDNIYEYNTTAIGALTTVYAKMSSVPIISSNSLAGISFSCGLSADEYVLFNGVTVPDLIIIYQNKLTSINIGLTNFYINAYSNIYVANAAIEGLNKAMGLQSAVKQQLQGEAKFIRAFFYFYLVNLYGDVPLIIGSDYQVNSKINRTPKAQVWDQIKRDLQEAKAMLNENFPDKLLTGTTIERVRPTKWAAVALLARTYLYTSNYSEAEQEASSIIADKSQFDIQVPLNQIFLKNSKEAIWQLQPVNAGWNTEDARTFTIPTTGPSDFNPVFLNDDLLNSFEPKDQRKNLWTKAIVIGPDTYTFPYKYQSAKLNDPVTEYNCVFRLAEQYLIRAEARIRQNKLTEGLDDLNTIRNRAGLADYAGLMDQKSILATILHERQVEFFSEWGHRWLDLKRTGKVDEVMNVVCPKKGGAWNTNQQLYPIPQAEVSKIPGMVNNPGY